MVSRLKWIPPTPEQTPQGGGSKSPELDIRGQAEEAAPAQGGSESSPVQLERMLVGVSREPISGINRQAVSYDCRCRRFRCADLVSALGVVDHVASDTALSSCP